MEKVESSMIRRSTLSKVAGTLLSENNNSSNPAQQGNASISGNFDTISRLNLASAIEQHGSGRKSLSESLLVDPNSAPGNVSLRKQFYNEEETAEVTATKSSEERNSFRVKLQFSPIYFNFLIVMLLLEIMNSIHLSHDESFLLFEKLSWRITNIKLYTEKWLFYLI